MIRCNKPLYIPELSCTITHTIYDDVGETTNWNFPTNISKSAYMLRNIIASGRLRITYPNSNELPDEGGVGSIYPARDQYDAKQFQITALEPNTSYYCVIPDNGYAVQDTTITAPPSGAIAVDHAVIMVMSSNFSINGREYTEPSMAAIRRDVVVAPPGTTIHQFKIVSAQQ